MQGHSAGNKIDCVCCVFEMKNDVEKHGQNFVKQTIKIGEKREQKKMQSKYKAKNETNPNSRLS